MEPFNFNELPEVIRLLFEKVEQIEILLQHQQLENDDPHEWLTVEEAAKFLKVTVGALYTKVSRKEIPVSKPGKKLYFNKTELKEWISSGRQKSATEIRKTAEEFAYSMRKKRSSF
jgi:excisionase family DNA binding protein